MVKIMDLEIIEKINSGLRKAGGDFPVVILTTEEIYDKLEIGEIPIKFIRLEGFSETDDRDCPFIPIYNDVKPDDNREFYFRKGYKELI